MARRRAAQASAGASLANWRLAQSVEGNGNRYGHQQKDGGRPQRAGPGGLGLAGLAGLLITAPHGVPSSASFARPVRPRLPRARQLPAVATAKPAFPR